MTPIQQDAVDVQKQIFDYEYYVNTYCGALAKHNMSTAGIEAFEYSDAQIVNLANTFWFALPDSPSIRRTPFFQLCNIAEHCFDEEPNEE